MGRNNTHSFHSWIDIMFKKKKQPTVGLSCISVGYTVFLKWNLLYSKIFCLRRWWWWIRVFVYIILIVVVVSHSSWDMVETDLIKSYYYHQKIAVWKGAMGLPYWQRPSRRRRHTCCLEKPSGQTLWRHSIEWIREGSEFARDEMLRRRQLVKLKLLQDHFLAIVSHFSLKFEWGNPTEIEDWDNK